MYLRYIASRSLMKVNSIAAQTSYEYIKSQAAQSCPS